MPFSLSTLADQVGTGVGKGQPYLGPSRLNRSRPWRYATTYAKARDRNRRLFERKLDAFRARGEEPAPLPMPERGRTIIFRTNPWVYNRWVAPMFGEITVVDESMFTVESFLDFVAQRRIDRVVFHNPYANEQMLALYRAVRERDIEFLVCERGALPGSVFFDARGFNGESASYAPQQWRRELGVDEQRAITDYICDLKCNGSALEDQPERRGCRALRRDLGLSPSAKAALGAVGARITSHSVNAFLKSWLISVRTFCAWV